MQETELNFATDLVTGFAETYEFNFTIEFNNTNNTARISTEGVNNWWALVALMLVVGTAAGNVLVCLAIYLERRLQNVTNYFLMSLAITDLLVAVLVMPLGILTLVRGKIFLILFEVGLPISRLRIRYNALYRNFPALTYIVETIH